MGQDFRPLESIDSTKRVITGDMNSESAQKAIKIIKDTRDRVQSAVEKLDADREADFAREFAVPPPSQVSNFQPPVNSDVKDLRWATAQIDGLMDGTTKADTERVGRILISAFYKTINDTSFRAPVFGEQGWIGQSARRAEPENVKRLRGEMVNLVQAADKLLSFVG